MIFRCATEYGINRSCAHMHHDALETNCCYSVRHDAYHVHHKNLPYQLIFGTKMMKDAFGNSKILAKLDEMVG